MKAGWGDWAGPGASGVSAKILSIRDRQLKIVEEETALLKKGRKDTKIPNVIISDRRVKTAAKYKIAELPHPFKSREEYERSMQMPLGGKLHININLSFTFSLSYPLHDLPPPPSLSNNLI